MFTERREVVESGNTLIPIDELSILLRSYGVNYCGPSCGRRDVLMRLSDENHETLFGARINPDSPYTYNGGATSNMSENYEGISISLFSRGWRPDAYFKGRVEDRYVNPDAVLNLNLSQFCGNGCGFCVRKYMNDKPTDYPQVSQEYITQLLDVASKITDASDLSEVEQISLVSGMRNVVDENQGPVPLTKVIQHTFESAKGLGFKGRIMYAGYNLDPKDAELIASVVPDFLWMNTIEVFERRSEIMPSAKGKKGMEEIILNMQQVKAAGVGTSFFYIAGMDSIDRVAMWMDRLRNCSNSFPNISLYDVYNEQEESLRDTSFAKEPLEYSANVASLVTSIYGPPNRGGLDSTATLWTPRKGLLTNKAFVLNDHWSNVPEMGPQYNTRVV